MTENHGHGSRRTSEISTAAATKPASSQWLLKNGASSHTEASTSAAVAPRTSRLGRTMSNTASSPIAADTAIKAVGQAPSGVRLIGGLPARCATTAMPKVRANQRHGSPIDGKTRDGRADPVTCGSDRLTCGSRGLVGCCSATVSPSRAQIR